MTLADFIIDLVRVVVAFGFLLVSVMLLIWFERKVISDMQNRIGPNRAGPFGILQTLADGIKLFFKEDLVPERSDRVVFKLAPYLAIVPALLSFVIIPVGGTVHIAHHAIQLQVADPPMGILFLLAMSGISVYSLMLAGWSSGSKYPLLGSVRASAQMVSYEAALSLSIAAVVLVTGGLTTSSIVGSQVAHPTHWLPSWNIVRLGVIPFVVFLIASTAEINRPPFDLVEGEQELVGGFHTEYSSLRFALFFLAEFMNTITMSAVAVTLFLGGPDGPIPHSGTHYLGPKWIWPIIWFGAKVTAFLFFQVWLRATLPRLRYDQLMNLGWKILIPVSLAWLLIVGAMKLKLSWGIAAIVASLVLGVGMVRALAVGKRDAAISERG